MKKLVFLFAALLPFFAIAQDVWKPGYVFNAAANNGTEVWFGPGNKVTMNGAFARGANVAASSGGFDIVEKGAVVLRDGRSVALTATRFASVGSLATAAARLAAGPVGIVAVLALPSVYEWITADNEQHIRVNPDRTGVELKSIKAHDWYINSFGGPYPDPVAACALKMKDYDSSRFTATDATHGFCQGLFGSDVYNTQPMSAVGSTELWLPSTMDDIAPYLTPRLPSPSYPKQIVDAGGEIDVTPQSLIGPSPALNQLPPAVKETVYPSPADITKDTTLPGNPFGLAPNTPTVTGTTKSSGPLSPGSSTTTGTPSVPFPNHPPVTTPKTTTTTSTYNPTSDTTTSRDVTKQDSAKQTSTVTNVTNITNTTNTSNVTNNTTTITNITNTTTNTPLSPPKTDLVTDKPLDDKRNECEKSPDSIGCSKFGTPPDPADLPRKSIPVTLSNAVFSAPGGCPAGIPMSVFGQSYAIEYSGLCDTLIPIRLIFLALGAAMAAMIFMEGLKA